MIAKDSGTGKSFIGLVRYLEHGKKGEIADRVEWTHGHELFTDDMKTAAAIMRETAALNDNGRLQKPVYHYSINWHPDESDRVDKATAITIAQESLKELGLEDHQALFVAHSDRDHFHLHIVVNRHNPEIGKAWNPDFTYVKLEKAMARLSLEHGFSVVPGHHNAYDLGIEPPSPDVSMPSNAAEYEDRTGNRSFLSQVREELAEDFSAATSWHDLTSRIEAKGYTLEARGAGLTITDGQHYSKPSAIDRDFSKARLQQRYGEAYREPGQRIEQEKPGRAERAPESLNSKEFAEKIRNQVTNDLRTATTWRDLETKLNRSSLVIARRGRGLVIHDGINQAKLSEITRQVSSADLTTRFDQSYKQYQYAQSRTNDAGDRASAARKLTAAIHHLKAHDNLVRKVEDHRLKLAATIAETEPVAEKLKVMSERRKAAERQFSKIYKNPNAALEKFETARKQGLARTIAKFEAKPSTFGALKGAGIGIIQGNERTRAMTAKRRATHLLRQYQVLAKEVAVDKTAIDFSMAKRGAAQVELKLINQAPDQSLKDPKPLQPAIKWTQGMGNHRVANDRRRTLENIVIEAARGHSIDSIQTLPLGDPIRAAATSEIVDTLRTNREQIRRAYDPMRLAPTAPKTDAEKWAAAEQKQIVAPKLQETIKSIRSSRDDAPQPLPKSANPAEKDAYAAVSRYADARKTLARSATRPNITAAQQAAEEVDKHGRVGTKYLRSFNLDKRDLRQDLKAARSLQYSRTKVNRTIGKAKMRLKDKLANILLHNTKTRDSQGRFAARGREREK